MAYPDSVYEGITSDPDTWGMCCDEEMARECAEEYYLRTRKKEKWTINVGLIVSMVALAGVAASAITILVLTCL